MSAFIEMVDFSDFLSMPREELDGLTLIDSGFNRSNPIKITYDNICVHEFSTEMKANPRPIFNTIIDVAAKYIDAAVSLLDKDAVVILSEDSWRVKNRFTTIELCLHCYSEYDQGDYVFEDVATHRVVVSTVAHFDTKFTYQSDKHNEEVFQIINGFYAGLKRDLSR